MKEEIIDVWMFILVYFENVEFGCFEVKSKWKIFGGWSFFWDFVNVFCFGRVVYFVRVVFVIKIIVRILMWNFELFFVLII